MTDIFSPDLGRRLYSLTTAFYLVALCQYSILNHAWICCYSFITISANTDQNTVNFKWTWTPYQDIIVVCPVHTCSKNMQTNKYNYNGSARSLQNLYLDWIHWSCPTLMPFSDSVAGAMFILTGCYYMHIKLAYVLPGNSNHVHVGNYSVHASPAVLRMGEPLQRYMKCFWYIFSNL